MSSKPARRPKPAPAASGPRRAKPAPAAPVDLTDATQKRMVEWQERFVTALAASPSVTAAARAAGITRQYAYEARKRDPAFAGRWDEALEEAADAAEAEIYRRGLHGWEAPVYQNGLEVGSIRKYSDRLLLAFLGARRRVYRTGAGASLNIDLSKLTDEQVQRIAAGEDPLSVISDHTSPR